MINFKLLKSKVMIAWHQKETLYVGSRKRCPSTLTVEKCITELLVGRGGSLSLCQESKFLSAS